jgi:hypothetical protein
MPFQGDIVNHLNSMMQQSTGNDAIAKHALPMAFFGYFIITILLGLINCLEYDVLLTIIIGC